MTAPEGKVATGEEIDFTRFRVVTDEGILAVFDADEDWDGRDEPLSQIAYWHDFASEQLFFFDQRLFTLDDVLQSIATMQRDLGIELAAVLAERPDFAPLPEITTPGQWRVAIEFDVLNVMAGGYPGARGDGEVSGLNDTCVPGTCPDPEFLASGALAAPVRGTSRNMLFASARGGANCNCSVNCNNHCPDPDMCTIGFCDDGTCVSQPKQCTGTNLCLEYRCDLAIGCTSEAKHCPEPDPCTTGGCIGITGVCRGSMCGENGKCCEDFATNHCCPSDYTCCEFHSGPPTNEYGCCPPERPLCLENRYCCATDKPFLCGSTCCATEEDCCNGDCKDSCYDVVCGEDGWYPGPECGETRCGLGQICCEGECCGLGPCFMPKCYPSIGLCVNYRRCDDGDDCTDDPCTPGECAEYECGLPTNNTSPCEPDESACTYDVCSGGECTHPPKPDGTSCTDDEDWCTLDICDDGSCSHPSRCPGQPCCESEQHCCQAGQSCCGFACCDEGEFCCPDGNTCCPNKSECCAGDCCGGDTTAGGSAEVCCLDVCCGDDHACCDDECLPSGCSVTLSSASGEPCNTIQLTLGGDCWPDCGNMGFAFEAQYPPEYNTLPPWLTISTPANTSCIGGSQNRTVSVTILGHAPPGEVPIVVTATTSAGTQCQATGKVTVQRTYPPIEIQYKTFIAPAALQLGPIDYYYKGDNRAFGYGANLSSRSVQSRTFSLDPAYNNGQPSDPTQFFGDTVGYDDDPTGEDIATGAMWPCPPYNLFPIAPPVPGDDCIMTAFPGVDPNVLTMGLTPVPPSELRVDITLAGRNPCQNSSAPSIDAHLHIHLRQVCENAILKPTEFMLYGTHDGFPWHEIYINQVLAFTHNPCCTGDGPNALWPGEEYEFETIDAPNPTGGFCDSPFPLGVPLGQWQTVPGLNR